MVNHEFSVYAAGLTRVPKTANVLAISQRAAEMVSGLRVTGSAFWSGRVTGQCVRRGV